MNEKLEEFLKLVNGKMQKCDFEEEEIYPSDWEVDDSDKIGKEEKHRWYSLQDTVYIVSFKNEPVGFIHGKVINQLYSENSGYEDIFHAYKFVACERIERNTIVYEYKDIN